MAAGSISLRYFILGLLTQQPMSGYDIKRVLKGLNWLTGSPSGGNLYPLLHAMRQDELVTMETVPALDRPPRKVYSITETGRQALRGWIDQPVASDAPLKAFVMRLLLADSFPQARLIAHLQQRRAQVTEHHDALHQAVDVTQAKDELGRFLAMDYGLAMALAEMSWLDNTLGELSKQQLPQ